MSRTRVAAQWGAVLAVVLALMGCEDPLVGRPIDGGDATVVDASIDATALDASAVDATDVATRCNIFEGGARCECDGGQLGSRACIGGVLSGDCTCRPPCSVTGCGDHQECRPDGTCACVGGWSLIRGFCQCVVPMEQCNPRDGGG